jgi:eukaryotic-like serine/threonine-protein kinase
MNLNKAWPERIGRFNVVKELGKGSQGVVYLARDPNLDRHVAIKTIRLHPSRNDEQQKTILREAKTVSKMQHPNIITVYEAGESVEGPFVVFEYVDGVSLRDLLRGNGGIVVDRAVGLMAQILDGISYAHQQGIIHRDISPSNILVGKNGIPRIMDFGLSIKTGTGLRNDISGTPCYMSPEHFSDKGLGPQADIFSLGLVFYEMLTGSPAVQAETDISAMYKIANEPIPPPSEKNPQVDNELDRIVMRAVSIHLDTRYGSASEMKKDLDDYLSPKSAEGVAPGQDTSGTLGFLLRRMRHKSDFPTFSHCIMEINQKASAKERNFTSASQIANVIIKDYALTSKLLKLVNSALYGSFGEEVTTVSRAVVILGFEQVKFAALSLMLFDHLQNTSQKAELQDAAVSSFMSAVIAKDLAEKMRVHSTEEAFICAMLHRLGKHLVIFYFPEEYEQIKRVLAQKAMDENSACRAVLGLSYDEIGSGIAKVWKFPDKIVRSMQSTTQEKVEKPESEEDLLQVLSAFSNELCQILGGPGGEEGGKAVQALFSRYEESVPASKGKVSDLLDAAMEKMEAYGEILNIKAGKNRFLAQVERFSKAEKSEVEKQAANAATREILENEFYRSLQVEQPKQIHHEADPDTVLLNGIQEITTTLLEEFEINDVMTMILETMYRGFRFHHVVFCLLDKRRTSVTARLGFGENMDRILEEFQFPVNSKSADVFNLALSHEKDLGIENSSDPRIQKGLPEWYLKCLSAPAFVICPIVVTGAPVGLIYADRNTAGKVLTGNQIKYMKTLCNQTVLAMKQLRRKS